MEFFFILLRRSGFLPATLVASVLPVISLAGNAESISKLTQSRVTISSRGFFRWWRK